MTQTQHVYAAETLLDRLREMQRLLREPHTRIGDMAAAEQCDAADKLQAAIDVLAAAK